MQTFYSSRPLGADGLRLLPRSFNMRNRTFRPVASFTLLVALVSGAAPCLANEAGEDEAPSQRRWFVAAEAGVGTGSHHASELGTGWGLSAGYRPLPLLWLGGAYRSYSGSGNDMEQLSVQAGTALAEFHPLGDSWVDPYVSVELGWGRWRTGYLGGDDIAWNGEAFGWAGSLGLGASFVLIESVGVGLHGRYGRRGEAHYHQIGPRLDVRF